MLRPRVVLNRKRRQARFGIFLRRRIHYPNKQATSTGRYCASELWLTTPALGTATAAESQPNCRSRGASDETRVGLAALQRFRVQQKKRNNFSGAVFFGAALLHLLQNAAAVRMTIGMGEEGSKEMATLDEIGQEKQKVSERLARLDAERAKLGAQLNELEVAERVLTRFGKVDTTERRRRGRPARTAPAPAAPRGRARAAAQPAQAISLSDATLRAVQAHGEGASPGEVLSYLSREFGMAVRPNHLGIALQRHRRAGRLETRDSRWFMPQSAMTA